MITISRAQIGKADGVQITAGSGWGMLEPTWPMVMAYKKNGDAQAYLAAYRSRLQRVDKQLIHRLYRSAKNGKLVITCYCRDGHFCHTYYTLKWLAEHELYSQYFRVADEQLEFVEGCDWKGEVWRKHS